MKDHQMGQVGVGRNWSADHGTERKREKGRKRKGEGNLPIHYPDVNWATSHEFFSDDPARTITRNDVVRVRDSFIVPLRVRTS